MVVLIMERFVVPCGSWQVEQAIAWLPPFTRKCVLMLRNPAPATLGSLWQEAHRLLSSGSVNRL